MPVNESITADQSGWVEQAFQYGAFARYARDLMQIHTPNEAIRASLQFLETMRLDGYLKHFVGKDIHPKRFGSEIPKSRMPQFAELQKLMGSEDKISQSGSSMVLKNPQLIIFLCLESSKQESLDALKDILVMFLDSYSAWVEHYILRKSLSDKLQNSLFEVIESSKDLLQNHKTASNDLMMDLVSQFPLLGLEADQENRILDIIETASSTHLQLIQRQIDRNNILGDTLIESVDALMHEELFTENNDQGKSDGAVELF